MPKKEHMFEKVSIKSYSIKSDADILYRIYKNQEEFADFPASSVSEAISKSDITTPYKIKILMPKARKYFEKNELEEVVEKSKELLEPKVDNSLIKEENHVSMSEKDGSVDGG